MGNYKGYEQLFAAAGTLQAWTEGAKRAAVVCTVLESDRRPSPHQR